MVEFALVLPLLLVLVYGLVEAGRMLFIYAAVASSSREAARYGSAVGGNNLGLPRYLDCSGIRQSARRIGSLAGIGENNITITYDDGDPAHILGNCPVGGVGSTWGGLGTRVMVSVAAAYRPIVPLVPIRAFTIRSETARTIIKDVSVGSAVAPSTLVPSVAVASSYLEVTEDVGVVTVVFHLSAPTGLDVFVPFTLSGSAQGGGVDFAAAPTVQVVIPAGATEGNLAFTIVDDAISEAAETIQIQMGAPVNADPGATTVSMIKILDNDAVPTLTYMTGFQEQPESAGSFTVEATLDFASGQEVRAPLLVDPAGTALPGVDFTLPGAPEIVIPAGSTYGFITVGVVDDSLDEDNETFTLVLGTPANAVFGPASITSQLIQIDDNDLPPLVGFTTDAQSGTENKASTIEVRLSAATSRDVTVAFSLSGTAVLNIDYTLNASPLVIPAGSVTAYVTINAVADGDNSEGDETVIVSMGAPANASPGPFQKHTLTITNRTVAFSAGGQLVNENAGTAEATVQLNAPALADVTVPYTVGGTSLPGVDFTIDPASASPLVIPAGQTSKKILIYIVDDTLDEFNETLSLTLGQPLNAALISPNAHTITFADNDVEPTVRFTTPNSNIPENAGSGAITIELSTPSGKDVTVGWTGGGSATVGVDYSIISPTLQTAVIPAGQTRLNLQFGITDDSYNEDNETIVETLTTVANGVLGDPLQHTASIVDNDAMPSVFFSLPNQIAAENQGDVSIGVALSSASGRQVTVDFTLGGSATLSSDYTLVAPVASQVVFPPGATAANIVVHIVEDSSPEFEEQIDVALVNPANAQLSAAQPVAHQVRITDNDSDRCKSMYSIGAVQVNNGQQKISATFTNGSGTPVTIVGFTLAWNETSTHLSGITLGSSSIWPQTPATISTPAWIKDNWKTSGSRTVGAGTYNLIFLFDGQGKLSDLLTLHVLLDNSCDISK